MAAQKTSDKNDKTASRRFKQDKEQKVFYVEAVSFLLKMHAASTTGAEESYKSAILRKTRIVKLAYFANTFPTKVVRYGYVYSERLC